MFAMVVGLPASGKTTWCKKQLEKDAENNIHISSDELREKYLGDVNEQKHNKDIFEIMFKKTISTLKSGKDVYYDATNINYKRRISLLEEIHRHCGDIFCKCVLFATPYDVCLRNNLLRERQVPQEVIKRMYLNFNIPSYCEGWNNIDIEYNFDENEYSFDKLTERLNITQDNHNHSLSLIEHSTKALEYSKELSNDTIVHRSAFLHDCGKPFVKCFENLKGEKTIDAHYYSHDNVGAYDSLFYNHSKMSAKDIIECANIIQHHMRPYFMDTQKSKDKLFNLVGSEMYKKIMIVHDCDVNAH